jgi:AAA+ superfamily predicted ATPase
LEVILTTEIADEAMPVLFVIKDIHGFLGTGQRGFDPQITRWIRDIAARFETSRHNLVFLSPTFNIPPELDKTLVVIDWPLPDTDELSAILAKCEKDLPSRIPVKLNGNRERVVQAMRGLSAFEAGSVLLSAIAATGELSETCIPYIVAEKSQIIKKDRVLEYWDETVTMGEIGGLKNLKDYAEQERYILSLTNRRGLDTPKGLLLVGVPGTGKSLAAKAIAGGQMPLLKMDMGALMGGIVGESEDKTRRALKLADACAPCILWLDEIEKGLGGVESSNQTDGGTTMRMFGTLLTYMQENTNPVYIVATANSTKGLRPEFLSRFDEVFFVDLPSHSDRKEIVSVHLAKRSLDPTRFDINAIAGALWGYSGREIEKVVKAAIKKAFVEKKDVTTEHLLKAAGELVPVSVTMKNDIDAVRAWAADTHARQAAEALEPQPKQQSTGSRMSSAEL